MGLACADSVTMANLAITEELEVLNAIYGEGTLSLLGEFAGKIRLRLELPTKEKAVYWLSFDSDYPQTIPQIERAELSLHQSTDRRSQNIFLALFRVLQEIFVPGNVCLFDLVETALPLIASLNTQHMKQSVMSDVDSQRWKWICKVFIDMDMARKRMECQVCFDELYAFEMIPAPCKHFFCFDCFARGWEVVNREGELYTCCLQPFPFETIKTYLEISSETEIRYLRLISFQVPNAFFCGNRTCGELVGSFSEWDLSRGKVRKNGIRCPLCEEYTCVYCRELKHPGSCVPEDEKIQMLLETGVFRRCPTCGEAIEKNGGCPHVQCITCSSHWWWAEDGKVEKYPVRRGRGRGRG